MPRYRTKPINPFLQRLMDERGWSNLKDVSEATGLTIDQVSRLADNSSNPVLKAHLRAAELLDIPMDVWVKGLLETSVAS